MRAPYGYKLDEENLEGLYAVYDMKFRRYVSYKADLEDANKGNDVESEFESDFNCGLIGGDFIIIKEDVYNDLCQVLNEYE